MTGQEKPRTLVRLTAGADELGIPRATARAWASNPGRRLWPHGLDIDGVKLYDLAEMRTLRDSTKRRRRRVTS